MTATVLKFNQDYYFSILIASRRVVSTNFVLTAHLVEWQLIFFSLCSSFIFKHAWQRSTKVQHIFPIEYVQVFHLWLILWRRKFVPHTELIVVELHGLCAYTRVTEVPGSSTASPIHHSVTLISCVPWIICIFPSLGSDHMYYMSISTCLPTALPFHKCVVLKVCDIVHQCLLSSWYSPLGGCQKVIQAGDVTYLVKQTLLCFNFPN